MQALADQILHRIGPPKIEIGFPLFASAVSAVFPVIERRPSNFTTLQDLKNLKLPGF